VVLVGSVGVVGFHGFRASRFWNDGAGHPLDRYTEHVVDGVANTLGALALYPHRGPPWLAFQRWAARAEAVHPSPLGLVIHPRFGLWHAYRAALAFAHPLTGLEPPRPGPDPCRTCAGRPCLGACPVDAFAGGGFDAGACRAHLDSVAGRECMEQGCRARSACPVAPELRYRAEQAHFHMAAFARSQADKHEPGMVPAALDHD
jgi:hypothetical protein